MSFLRNAILLLAIGHSACSVRAHEGMWLPTLLKAIEGDMRTEGLEITAEDIYSINNGSLKDATVLFGGGCTAEVLSTQGLILTNHHCGFSAIQQHSSLEHDYLKDGFMAATLADELPNPNLRATFIVRMEDVTAQVLAGLGEALTEQQRKDAAQRAGEAIARKAVEGTGWTAVVRPFNYGNSYYLIVSETYPDIRLVCAPPGGVGKFGGDTDNWMWPRHTGDFSIFRIYAGPDNAPADYSKDNVPYVPKRSLKVSMDGVKEGDFTMIYGFPGSTQRYLPSVAVDHVMNTSNPLRIRMREASLRVIDEAMLASDRTRIQYASKQSGISNGYKKWIGEVRGLKGMDALAIKRAEEAAFTERARGTAYAGVLPRFDSIYAMYPAYAQARDLFGELLAGPEIIRCASSLRMLASTYADLGKQGKLEEELGRLRKSLHGFYEDYDPEVDRHIFRAQAPIYAALVPPALAPAPFNGAGGNASLNTDAWVDRLYAGSILDDSVQVFRMLAHFDAKAAKKLAKDPAILFTNDLYATYETKMKPKVTELTQAMEANMRSYVKGRMELFPEKTYWPDANSTLRLSYGKVEGSDPYDGVHYKPFTTLRGIMEKYKPGDPEFDVPKTLRDRYAAKDLAPYGDNEDMPVCFTSSLHTTGGNSGSPVFNGRGELVGLNFDRTWESTMSDILFNPAKCRNIAVDIRYVLWVVDKVCGGRRLVDEMELTRKPDVPSMIKLPIHR
ncbi:MAG: S46 family peptidase [Flavobacteriales bacterium]